MKKPQTNYAFIDGNNLHLTTKYLGWDLDYKKFRVYLSEHYGVGRVYYFIGYLPENVALYTALQSYGYVLVFKPTLKIKGGRVKGNCDAELVLQAMIDWKDYEKAVIVTSDGDFACLVEYLRRQNKLQCVLAPCLERCSHLLKKATRKRIAFIDPLREKLKHTKRKEPYKDKTS